MGAPKTQEVREDGYVVVYRPGHPRSNRDGYVLEHRLVMEDYLGGPIPHGHQVHHLDRRRANNRTDNLVLVPSAGLHVYLHNLMKVPGKRNVVRAMESWFKEITGELRNRYLKEACARVEPLRQASAEDEPPDENLAEVEIDESQVAKVLLSLSDKKVRARQFMELIERYGEEELFDLLSKKNSLPMGANIVRLIWSVGSLKIHRAGNWFLGLMDEWDTEAVHLAVYTNLFIRFYQGLDQGKLTSQVSRETGGKPLAYGIKALGRQCSGKDAIAALRKIRKRTDFGYDRERIEWALSKSIRYIKYRGR